MKIYCTITDDENRHVATVAAKTDDKLNAAIEKAVTDHYSADFADVEKTTIAEIHNAFCSNHPVIELHVNHWQTDPDANELNPPTSATIEIQRTILYK